MHVPFEDRTILIVGAGGIGFAAARLLAQQGARLALADTAISAVLERAMALSPQNSHSAHIVDITDPKSIDAALASVLDVHRTIHGVVITSGAHAQETFLETSEDLWQRMFAINATGTFLVSQAAARIMKESAGGRIVAVASMAGRQAQLRGAAYGSAKAAVIHLVRYMAIELAKYGITVNALCPGSTATPMMGSDPQRRHASVHGDLDQWRLGIPLGRMAEADDQAAAISFLLSDDARHITGQVISVDGGQSMR